MKTTPHNSQLEYRTQNLSHVVSQLFIKKDLTQVLRVLVITVNSRSWFVWFIGHKLLALKPIIIFWLFPGKKELFFFFFSRSHSPCYDFCFALVSQCFKKMKSINILYLQKLKYFQNWHELLILHASNTIQNNICICFH